MKRLFFCVCLGCVSVCAWKSSFVNTHTYKHTPRIAFLESPIIRAHLVLSHPTHVLYPDYSHFRKIKIYNRNTAELYSCIRNSNLDF